MNLSFKNILFPITSQDTEPEKIIFVESILLEYSKTCTIPKIKDFY